MDWIKLSLIVGIRDLRLFFYETSCVICILRLHDVQTIIIYINGCLRILFTLVSAWFSLDCLVATFRLVLGLVVISNKADVYR